MIWIISIIAIIVIVYVFKKFSGEDERIKTFLRIYRSAKRLYPEKNERELLEIVVGEFTPTGKSIKLKNAGISGKTYIGEVFESENITIIDLIKHLIMLEFPNKYPTKIDLKEIGKRNRDGNKSKDEILVNKIKKYHHKLLNENL